MGHKRSRSASFAPSDSPDSPHSREPTPDVKIVHLTTNSSNATTATTNSTAMKCTLPPHPPLTFPSYSAYETHYHQTHTNRCSTCHTNHPSPHFLDLHITEHHDPITAARKDRGDKVYACLVPECDRLCSTPAKRRLHCIDKHGFPKNYDFFVVKDGIDRRWSLLRPSKEGNGHRRRSSTMTSSASTARDDMEISTIGSHDEDEEDGGSSDGSSSPLSPPTSPRAPVRLHGRGGFTHPPRQSQFGRGRGRGRGVSKSVAKSPEVLKAVPAKPMKKDDDTADPMDGLTSSMSSLQFVPHAVRTARGRGRG
ncbi:hypothetical protein BU24DRAFT_380958, partial [Aaosphaeria arxii CBS 175.79]